MMSFDDELRSRGFGVEMGLGNQPAIVVVDMTVAFTDPGSPLYCDSDVAVDAIARMLGAARESGCPVVFSTVIVDGETHRKAGHFLRKMPGLLAIEESPEYSDIDSRVAPKEGEQVLPKVFPSAFFDTDLNEILASHDVDTVIVTGASTSGCVRATAVDALQYGYRVALVPEAVADRDPGAGAGSLRDLSLKYADLISIDKALDYLRGAGNGS